MRIGQNPAKAIESVRAAERVTAAVVVYIPALAGYYAQSLDVLKACLSSLRQNAGGPLDLLVFDNASCEDVRTYLNEEHVAGNIQYLVLSEHNVGKAGAWNFIFNAAPGEFIAYADADVRFLPGWLAPHLAALEAFPQAGMVTGLPLLTPPEFSTATVARAESELDVHVERGRFISWEDFWRHARSLGGDEPKARAFYEANEAVRLERNGAHYYVGAGHFQFVARKRVLQQVLPIPSTRPMGDVRQLDERINAAGFLRLSTPEWHVEHMGNVLPEGAAAQELVRPRRGLRGPLRRLVQWVYDRSFEWLYRK
ncbi:MAG: glycosyltransferase family 2 protein [Anaerolineae bacterium]|nr:MAG: glycosyltransferase family 2 protein [Anaerolineae bacterium]